MASCQSHGIPPRNDRLKVEAVLGDPVNQGEFPRIAACSLASAPRPVLTRRLFLLFPATGDFNLPLLGRLGGR